MKSEWIDDLSIGNEMIDSEHKNLLSMVNQVEHAIRNGNCSDMSQAFERFVGRLRAHFIYEEDIARAVKVPFTQHKLAQQYFLEELDFLKNELLGKAGMWCGAAIKHYSDLLRGLLIDHITGKDILMKHILHDYQYDKCRAEITQRFLPARILKKEINRAQ